MVLPEKYQENFGRTMKFLIIFTPLFPILLLILEWANTITLNISTSQLFWNAVGSEITWIAMYFIIGRMIKK